MIEKVVLDYLSSKLDCDVYMEIPQNPPKTFVRVEKTGSSKSNYICSATFAIQSYADTLLNACELNEKVKDAMDIMDDTEDIFSARLNSDYNYTDTSTKKYRYQCVYDLKY